MSDPDSIDNALAERQERKSFDFDEFLKKVKLGAFDIGLTIVFLVTLYRVVMHEIGR